MPNFKITQLPSASQIETDDLFPFVDVSEIETKRVATSQIIDLAAVTITEMPNLVVDPSGNFADFPGVVRSQFKPGSNITIDFDGTISSTGGGGTGTITEVSGGNNIVTTNSTGPIVEVALTDSVTGLSSLQSTIISGSQISGTFSGSGNLINNLNADNISSGILDVQFGGTGTGSLQSGSLVVGNNTSTVGLIAPGINGQVLTVVAGKWEPSNPTGGGGGVSTVTSSNSNIIVADSTGPTVTLTLNSSLTNLTSISSSQISSSFYTGSNAQFTSITGSQMSGSNAQFNTITGSISGSKAEFKIISGSQISGNFSGSGALINNINANNINAGILSVQYGGTGTGSLESGSLIIGNGTNNVSFIAPSIENKVLKVIGGKWTLETDLVGTGGGSGISQVTSSNSNIIVTDQTGPTVGLTLNPTLTNLTSISSSQISGTFSGSGALIDNLNANRVNAGILGVQFGGTGLNSLSGTGGNGVLVGDGANSATIVTGTVNNQVLKWNNSTKIWYAGTDQTGGGNTYYTNNASGPDNSIQIKSGSTTNFTGSSGLIWDFTNSVLGIGGTPTQTSKKLEITGSDVLINGLTVGRGGTNANFSNTAVGYLALLSANNLTQFNTAIGSEALKNNTANQNTAVGYFSLNTNTAGTLNTALGHAAAFSNTGGSDNVFVGAYAGNGNTIGNNNIFIGRSAGREVTSGTNNIFIGTEPSIVGYGNVSDTIIFRTTSERIRVNNTGCAIAKGGANPNATLDVGGNTIISGTLTVTSTITEQSTRAIKNNIQTIDSQLAKIMMLNPVSYNRKDDNRKEFGFVSEELREIYPEFVLNDAVAYPKMVSVLVGALKELTQKLENQQAEIDLLKRGLKDGSTSKY